MSFPVESHLIWEATAGYHDRRSPQAAHVFISWERGRGKWRKRHSIGFASGILKHNERKGDWLFWAFLLPVCVWLSRTGGRKRELSGSVLLARIHPKGRRESANPLLGVGDLCVLGIWEQGDFSVWPEQRDQIYILYVRLGADSSPDMLNRPSHWFMDVVSFFLRLREGNTSSSFFFSPSGRV